MTSVVLKSQIIKSLNNLHLKGTIDEGLEKNSDPLFSSSNNGAINISEIGLYQIIDSMIEQLINIINRDKITRRIGIDISKDDYYTTSVNRYSLKNREKQLYDVFQKAPVITNNTFLDLSNNIDGSASSTNLTCQIVYKDGLYDNSDGTPLTDVNEDGEPDNLFTEANLKSNEFISLQIPTKYINDVRKSGEQKFVLRAELSGGQEAYDNAYNNAYNSALANGDDQNEADTAGTTAGNNARNTYNNENNKYFYRATDNCIEFLRETDTDTTMTNLTNAIDSISEFTATINTTSKTITITQSNTDGIIIDNISFFTDGIQLPIQNFRSLRYKQFIANTISKTIKTRGCESNIDTRLSLLNVCYDLNGVPVKKYSEDALFEFFGRMTYEFIKLNNNHIGKEENYPGSYKLENASIGIASHHLNSVENYEIDNTIDENTIKKTNVIQQLLNIKKNGFFGSIDINVNKKQLSEQYKFIDINLFTNSTDSQNIPHKDDDSNAIGLYQIINNLIYQIQFFKKKIQKREKELIKILKDSSSSSNTINLQDTIVNNLQAKTSYCQTQGALSSTQWKPSFIEINNSTDYTPSIEYKYSQDALYELCGRWLNELLKLNNGHSGNENIYPGFYDTSKTTISEHHLNSVIGFIEL